MTLTYINRLFMVAESYFFDDIGWPWPERPPEPPYNWRSERCWTL